MKGKTLTVMGGLVALIVLSVFGQADIQPSSGVSQTPISVPVPIMGKKIGLGKMLAQKTAEAETQATAVIPTAAEVLEKIKEDATRQKNPIPLEIYPPGIISNLMYLGNSPAYTIQPFDPKAYRLKAGDKANMGWFDAEFTMGSPTSEALRNSDESQHTAIISYGFYMGNYEITQDEYNQIMGSNPSYFTPANGYTTDLNRPVESVTWAQANAFCAALTSQALANGSIQSGWLYRLPTEAEWEYSCRARTKDQAVHGFVDVLYQDIGTSLYTYASANFPYSIDGDTGSHNGQTIYAADLYFQMSAQPTDLRLTIGDTQQLGAGHSYSKPYVTWADDLTVYGLHTLVFQTPTTVTWSDGISIGPWSSTGFSQWTKFGADSANSYQVLGKLYGPNYPGANTYMSFNFGGAIRGGYANFDDHYEYDITGTINVSSPTIPYLAMTADVGSYNANPFDLFDMHGNVSEWCQDYYGAYPTTTLVDYQGPTSGSTRVVRGGSWADEGYQLRSAARSGVSPTTASSHIGFRIVLAPGTPEWKTAVTATPSIKTYGFPRQRVRTTWC